MNFILFFIFLYISLTVGASRLIEVQVDLPRLLFGVGFQIFIVTPQMFLGSLVICWERARLITATASDAYKRC